MKSKKTDKSFVKINPLVLLIRISYQLKQGDFCVLYKVTGIVRRIDNLGRVVIPKEIRER